MKSYLHRLGCPKNAGAPERNTCGATARVTDTTATRLVAAPS